ncbi:hypothetical protein UlMin_020417 [Ulmus minor]
MEEAMAARYWCHVCSQIVNPIVEVEIKCPFCQSGFVEEMSSSSTREGRDAADAETNFGSNRALSLWAPILLGMMGNPRQRRRFRRIEFDDGDNDDDDGLELIICRRRKSSANILQLLQGIRAGLASESQNSELFKDRDQDRDDKKRNENQTPIGFLGNYFIDLGLNLLLQNLAKNDPNRYGTSPAKKEAMEALPTVMIQKNFQCSICLDDFETGSEAKKMPCKYRFHSRCILPWLELHSSCPICRFLLPSNDESKRDRFRGEDDRF